MIDPKNKRLTCLQCGADLTLYATHTLMDCIQHLRNENELLKEQIQGMQGGKEGDGND